MMNVEQITSRLPQMSDEALQQYALMNREDPYIMALAISESRRRKQMRAAAAAPQPQAQPKVADRALMEMGVDALPAGEMDFAGGGIVAFADGGDVERYNGATGSLTGDVQRILQKPPYARTPEENAMLAQAGYDVQTRSLGPSSGLESANTFLQGIGPRIRNYFTAGASRLTDEELAKQPGVGGAQNERILRAMGMAPSTVPLEPQASYSNEARRQPIGVPIERPAPASPAAPGAARTGTATAGAPAQGGLGATPEAAAARKTAGPATGATTVQGAKDLADQFYDAEAEKKNINDYMVRRRNQIAEMRSRYGEGKPEGKAYSKFEEMLKAEEGRASKEKDEATGVAIFKAGLAMMAGTSPRAFENIGKGSLAGLEEYTSAMKDMKKAAKERQKAFAEIENARRAEERDDWKAKNAAEAKYEEHLDAAERYGVEGISKVTGKKADVSRDLYKLNVEQQGLTDRTRMTTSAMLARGAGNEDKQTLNELKALQQNLNDQLKSSPRMMGPAGDPLRAQLQQINAAIARMAGLGTMPGAPGAGSPGGIPPDVQALLNKYGGK